MEKSSVEKSQVTHFNDLSVAWWGKGLEILHTLNELRVPFVENCVRSVDSSKSFKSVTVLEVGCGGGILSESLAKLGCSITGVDVAEEAIKVAQAHASLDKSLTNLVYECCTIEDFSVRHENSYDVVVASEVIEHTADPKLFLEACVKCLKPGGSIIVTTFNKTNTAWFMGVILAEYVFRAIPIGTHEYEKFISPSDTEKMLNSCGCTVRQPVRGMWYNFFSGKWFWTVNENFCYALHAVKNQS